MNKSKKLEGFTQEELKEIRTDMMRYKNNSLSFWLSILALVLNVAMFLIIYTNKDCRSSYQSGLDLMVNVIVLLACFLIAEKTKAYSTKASIGAFVVGGIQIARIFWIPLYYYNCNVKYLKALAEAEAAGTAFKYDGIIGMTAGDFTKCVILLVVSALALIAAGLIAIYRHKVLQKHIEGLQESR